MFTSSCVGSCLNLGNLSKASPVNSPFVQAAPFLRCNGIRRLAQGVIGEEGRGGIAAAPPLTNGPQVAVLAGTASGLCTQ